MKKLALLAAMTAVSANVMAAGEIVYNSTNVNVVKFSDEFTGETTSCQMNIGKYERKSPRLSIFGRNFDTLSVMGNIGNFDGSGFQFKIDDGQMYKYGRSYAGGDTLYIDMPDGLLEQLSNGSKLILRVHPDNQYLDSRTETYSLKGSAKAVAALKACYK